MDAALHSRRPAAPSRSLLTAAACAPAEEVLAGLESGGPGLIAAKAARRKMTYGPNAVATHAARFDPVLWQQLRSALLGTWLLDRYPGPSSHRRRHPGRRHLRRRAAYFSTTDTAGSGLP